LHFNNKTCGYKILRIGTHVNVPTLQEIVLVFPPIDIFCATTPCDTSSQTVYDFRIMSIDRIALSDYIQDHILYNIPGYEYRQTMVGIKIFSSESLSDIASRIGNSMTQKE